MIKKLNLLVIKSFIGPLIATFFVALFVLLMQFLWLYIDDLVGKGLSVWIIAELLFYASAHLVPMALPLAVLLASIMTFGNMGEHFELTAIKAAGISLQRIMLPLIIISALMAYGAFFFANTLQPIADLKFYTLLYDVKQQHPALDIKEGIFNNDIEGVSLKIGDKHSSETMMFDFMIYDHKSQSGNKIVTLADSGTIKVTDNMKFLIVELYSGVRYEEVEETEKDMSKRSFPEQTQTFDKQTIIFPLNLDFEKSDESLFKHNYQMLNVNELANAVDSLKAKYTNRQELFNENLLRLKMLKNEIKVVTKEDSANFARKDSILNSIPVQDLPVNVNIDSIYNNYTIDKKREVLSTAIEYSENTISEIVRTKEDLIQRRKYASKHEVALHQKFTFSLACFIFFFIGAPLGAIIRKGGFGLPIVVSVLFFIIYYIITMTTVKFVKEGVWNAYIGVWFSSYLLMPIGIFLTYKATTDSSIFNVDSYVENIKKFFNKFKIKPLRKIS